MKTVTHASGVRYVETERVRAVFVGEAGTTVVVRSARPNPDHTWGDPRLEFTLSYYDRDAWRTIKENSEIAWTMWERKWKP